MSNAQSLALRGTMADGVLTTDVDLRTIGTTTIIRSVKRSLRYLQRYLPKERRGLGVYVCVILNGIITEPVPVIHCLIGPVPWNTMSRYHTFSEEKAARVLEYPAHSLSWQSRDDKLKRYQGAAKSLYRAIGISGLPSAADEAIAIKALVDADDITPGDAKKMAAISKNEYYGFLSSTHP